jgi:hypothetical protein
VQDAAQRLRGGAATEPVTDALKVETTGGVR